MGDTNDMIAAQLDGAAPSPGPKLEVDHAREAVRARLFPDDATPVRFGRFEALERVGTGGMGIVYSAYDPDLDRRVALKVLGERPGHSAGDSRGRERLLREARAMARIDHPNVVSVHEVGTHDGHVFIAMDLVRGRSLEAWLAEGPHGWKDVLDRFVQAGQGLAAAHAGGLVHRDFKPANALIGDDERVRVVDFGLARSGEGENEGWSQTESAPGEDEDGRLTKTGAVLGTPAYMAPEQWGGDPADERSDQFSFCVALFEGLHGQRPFQGRTRAELAARVQNGHRTTVPLDRTVPGWLQRAVDRGLARDAADRWPSMEALLRHLASRRGARRGIWVVGAVLAAAGLALGAGAVAVLDSPQDPCAAANERLRGVWDDDIEARLGASFEHALDAPKWARLAGRLDRHATQWAETYEETCRATVPLDPDAFGPHLACLNERRRELGAFVHGLESASDPSLDRAIVAASAFRHIEDCTNPALAPLLDPPSSEMSDEVDSIRDGLAAARSLQSLGRPKEARVAAATLHVRAEATGYAPVLAEAELALGLLHRTLGEEESAEQLLTEAFYRASGLGHDDVVLRASVGLIKLESSTRKREKAEAWGRHARAAVIRRGDQTLEETQRLEALAYLALFGGDHQLAADRLRQAMARWDADPDRDPVARAETMDQLANVVAGGLRRPEEAVQIREEAVDIRVRELGPDHAAVARGHLNLANDYTQLDRDDDALVVLDRAIAILGVSPAEQVGPMVAAYRTKARIMRRKERFDDARQWLRAARDLSVQVYGEPHSAVAKVDRAWGDLELDAGEPARAEALFRKALEVEIATSGEADASARRTRIHLADAMVAQGRLDEAISMLKGTVHREFDDQGESRGLVAARQKLGRLMMKADRHAEAIEEFERAIAWTNGRSDADAMRAKIQGFLDEARAASAP